MAEPDDDDLLALGRILHRFLTVPEEVFQPYAAWRDLGALILDGQCAITDQDEALFERLYAEEPDPPC